MILLRRSHCTQWRVHQQCEQAACFQEDGWAIQAGRVVGLSSVYAFSMVTDSRALAGCIVAVHIKGHVYLRAIGTQSGAGGSRKLPTGTEKTWDPTSHTAHAQAWLPPWQRCRRPICEKGTQISQRRTSSSSKAMKQGWVILEHKGCPPRHLYPLNTTGHITGDHLSQPARLHDQVVAPSPLQAKAHYLRLDQRHWR